MLQVARLADKTRHMLVQYDVEMCSRKHTCSSEKTQKNAKKYSSSTVLVVVHDIFVNTTKQRAQLQA